MAKSKNNKTSKILYMLILLILITPINILAASGCCSHHGGISYCGSNGYYICNDGTQSPSCSCLSNLEYGGIILTDSSCDYSNYEGKINDLEKEKKLLENDLSNQKDKASNYQFLFWITLVVLIIYYFYKKET